MTLLPRTKSPSRLAGILSPIALAAFGAALLVVALGSSSPSHAATPSTDTIVLHPSLDTYIDEADPEASFSDAETLLVQQGEDVDQLAALRFAVSTALHLADHPGDAQIESATLRLRVAGAPEGEPGVVLVRRDEPFSSTSTWDAARSDWLQGNLGESITVESDDEGKWLEFDVSADVQAFVDGTASHGWSLHAVSAGTVAFHSSEAEHEDNHPQLEITYATHIVDLQPESAYPSDEPGDFEDTYYQSEAASSARGQADNLLVDLTETNRSDALVRFGLDSLDPQFDGSRILAAELTFTVKSSSLGRTLAVTRVCGPGTLAEDGAITGATYNNIPYAELDWRGTSPGQDYEEEDEDISFDVTGIVQAWADGEANMGFRLFQQTPEFGAPNQLELHSFNSPDETKRPRLQIEYVDDRGEENPVSEPTCVEATPTPTPTNTTVTETPEDTTTPETPAPETPTPETPTSEPGDVETGELQLGSPSEDRPVSRSRLTFAATHGSLDPEALGFVIERSGDGKYWDAATGEWQDEPVVNDAAQDGSSWAYAVAPGHKRSFANTTLTVEVRAESDGQTYISDEATEILVR